MVWLAAYADDPSIQRLKTHREVTSLLLIENKNKELTYR